MYKLFHICSQCFRLKLCTPGCHSQILDKMCFINFKNVAHHFHNEHQRRTIAVLFSYRACSIRTLLNDCVRCNETFQPANAAIFRPSLHQHIYFAVLHSAFAEQLTAVCAEQKNGKYLLPGTTTRFIF